VLRSSGTSPNFRISLASLKSPPEGSPVRERLRHLQRVFDLQQRRPAYDRLRALAPAFGKAGRVEQMVGSLQLISMAGSFNRDTVIQHFEWKTDVSCATRIYASAGLRGHLT
jgi:hypothetical protein